MKDTCKQAIFRKDTRRVRRAEDHLRAGDRKERELEFFNKEAGLTEKNFDEAMKVRSRRYGGGYVPFEQWMQKGRNLQSDVADTTTLSTGYDDPSSSVFSSGNAQQVQSVLSTFLQPKEMEALSCRYRLLKDGSR